MVDSGGVLLDRSMSGANCTRLRGFRGFRRNGAGMSCGSCSLPRLSSCSDSSQICSPVKGAATSPLIFLLPLDLRTTVSDLFALVTLPWGFCFKEAAVNSRAESIEPRPVGSGLILRSTGELPDEPLETRLRSECTSLLLEPPETQRGISRARPVAIPIPPYRPTLWVLAC